MATKTKDETRGQDGEPKAKIESFSSDHRRAQRSRRRPRKRSCSSLLSQEPLELDDSDFRLEMCHSPRSRVRNTILSPDDASTHQQHCLRSSLPLLLLERETFGLSRHSASAMRRDANANTTLCWSDRALRQQHTRTSSPNKTWRPFCHQRLRFRELGTLATDAVLGLDQTASFAVALGEGPDVSSANAMLHTADSGKHSSLALRLLGLPRRGRIQFRAPLLLTVPLENSTTTTHDERIDDESSLWEALACSGIPAPARVPVRVWLCSDGRLGACMYRMYRPTTTPATRIRTVSVVLFPLPQALPHAVLSHSDVQGQITEEAGVVVHKLTHVHVPIQRQQDSSPSKDSNLLWMVSFCPNRDSCTANSGSRSWFCESVVEVSPAYFFLVDEKDGYRLTWIREGAWNESELRQSRVSSVWNDVKDEDGSVSNQQHQKQVVIVRSNIDTRIVVPVSPVDAGWETRVIDRQTGATRDFTNDYAGQHLTIACTGFFSATALLHDILTRRPNLVRPRFDNTVASLPSYSYHLVGMTGGRVIQILLVFSVGPVGHGCIGVFVSVDLLTQDYQELEWIRHMAFDTPPATCGILALKRRLSTLLARDADNDDDVNDLQVESLYPDCQTLDNLAVRRQIPITSMAARSAPVEVTYF